MKSFCTKAREYDRSAAFTPLHFRYAQGMPKKTDTITEMVE